MSSFICPECGKSYNYNKNLRHHVRKVHPQKQIEIFAAGRDTYKCCECDKIYFKLASLHDHEFKVHQIQNSVRSPSSKCPLCDVSLHKSQLLNHFEADHDITLEHEDLEFESEPDFLLWKETLEKGTNSRFVKISGIKKRCNFSITYFYCHRSGNYVSKSNGIRNLKTQGSNKINHCCPANLKLYSFNDGSCKVHFIKTHLGHQNSSQHLYITEAERGILAAKIANNIPFDDILTEMQASASGKSCERLQHLTKKDLYNIEVCYDLNSKSRSKTNVDTMAEKRMLTKKSRIIQSRHKASLLMKDYTITLGDDGWYTCFSLTLNETTYVQFSPTECSCSLICNECHTCIHNFTCTCEDYTDKSNMCKHMHLIAQFNIRNHNAETTTTDECLSNDGQVISHPDNEVCVIETDVIFEDLTGGLIQSGSKTMNSENLRIEREYLKDEFAQIVDGLSSSYELKAVKTCLDSLKTALDFG